MKRKKKIKVYGRINLLETSAVGIPSYPYAHMNTSCSLIKSLKAFDDEIIKFNQEVVEMDTKSKEDVIKQETTAVEKLEEKSEEKSEEESDESEESEEEEDEEKSLTPAIVKAIREGLKEALTPRGLVEDEKSSIEKTKDLLKDASFGELVIAMTPDAFKPQ